MMAFFKKLFARRPSYPELRQVIVNLKSGTSVKGVVWEHRDPYVVVRGAVILSDRGQHSNGPIVVDGEVAVLSQDIDFIQVM